MTHLGDFIFEMLYVTSEYSHVFRDKIIFVEQSMHNAYFKYKLNPSDELDKLFFQTTLPIKIHSLEYNTFQILSDICAHLEKFFLGDNKINCIYLAYILTIEKIEFNRDFLFRDFVSTEPKKKSLFEVVNHIEIILNISESTHIKFFEVVSIEFPSKPKYRYKNLIFGGFSYLQSYIERDPEFKASNNQQNYKYELYTFLKSNWSTLYYDDLKTSPIILDFYVYYDDLKKSSPIILEFYQSCNNCEFYKTSYLCTNEHRETDEDLIPTEGTITDFNITYTTMIDTDFCLKIFTYPSDNYKKINLFLEYYCYNIIFNSFIPANYESTGKFTSNIIDDLDTTFIKHRDNIATETENFIKSLKDMDCKIDGDNLIVYRTQSTKMLFTCANYLRNSKSDTYVFFSTFISTSCYTNMLLQYIMRKPIAAIILQITLPFNLIKDWIPILNYSSCPHEVEVLINRNSKFKIVDISYCNLNGRSIKKVKLEFMGCNIQETLPKKYYTKDDFSTNYKETKMETEHEMEKNKIKMLITNYTKPQLGGMSNINSSYNIVRDNSFIMFNLNEYFNDGLNNGLNDYIIKFNKMIFKNYFNNLTTLINKSNKYKYKYLKMNMKNKIINKKNHRDFPNI